MNSSQLYYKRGKSKSRSSDSSPDLKSCDEVSQTSHLSLSPNLDGEIRLPSLKFNGSSRSKLSKQKQVNAEAFSQSFAKLVAYCEMVRNSEFKDSGNKEEVINL